MILTIHQPEHMPWLGFFHKSSLADCLVLLDNVQFRKNYFQNRNRIRNATGWSWITVPVHRKSDTLIKDVVIPENGNWRKKWWNSIYYAYGKCPYFKAYADQMKETIDREWRLLSELNISLIKLLNRFFGIEVDYVCSSDICAEGAASDLILDICRKLGAKVYLSGISGREYLNESDFVQHHIRIAYQKFFHPIYHQRYEPFEPRMSAMDLLFNHGPDSLDIIRGNRGPTMDQIFL